MPKSDLYLLLLLYLSSEPSQSRTQELSVSVQNSDISVVSVQNSVISVQNWDKSRTEVQHACFFLYSVIKKCGISNAMDESDETDKDSNSANKLDEYEDK